MSIRYNNGRASLVLGKNLRAQFGPRRRTAEKVTCPYCLGTPSSRRVQPCRRCDDTGQITIIHENDHVDYY